MVIFSLTKVDVCQVYSMMFRICICIHQVGSHVLFNVGKGILCPKRSDVPELPFCIVFHAFFLTKFHLKVHQGQAAIFYCS